jgi:hypothetical protein
MTEAQGVLLLVGVHVLEVGVWLCFGGIVFLAYKLGRK